MRRRVLLAVCSGILLLGVAATAHPIAKDFPSEGPARSLDDAGLDDAGLDEVESFLGSNAPAGRNDRRARNISLVGAYRVADDEAVGGTAGYKKLAFLGKWGRPCPASGVEIIDISRPSAPVKLDEIAKHPNTSKAEMEAIEIGTRDVLAIGLQRCGPAGRRGLEMVDITDPASPQALGFFDTTPTGVVDLDLTTTPSGRTLALLASADRELVTSSPSGSGGIGDLLIVDVSNPANPRLVGEWGVLDEPALGLPFYLSARRGGFPDTHLHGVRAGVHGTRAYLSYWDGGHIVLDISDPSNPTFLGRAAAPPSDEGNAHSAWEGRGGNLLVTADEDFSPFYVDFRITTGPNAGQYPALEGAFTKPIGGLADKAMNGSTTFIGLACSASDVPAAPDDGDLLTDEIAVAERGVCFFQTKAAVAEARGYDGFIVINSAAGGDTVFQMPGSGETPVPQLPGILVGRTTGLKIFGVGSASSLTIGQAGETADAQAEFDGWGFLRVYDIQNPASPVQIGAFATANTNDEAVASQGRWSIHNPEVRGNLVYASWYSDGVRIIDISQPSAPREVGSWTGGGAPEDAPAVDVWSAVPHGDLLLASDRNFGLYILKRTP